MARLNIGGASDDLIEVTGALDEEFCHLDFGNGGFVYVSTGDVLKLWLDEDGWQVRIVVNVTGPVITGRAAPYGADKVAVIVADQFHWVVATTTPPVLARHLPVDRTEVEVTGTSRRVKRSGRP